MGGPVYIPKLYNGKDKTFFFYSYQKTFERRTPQEVGIVVPTAAQRNGQFTTQIIDPATRQPFPNNQIPANQISPISRGILEKIPAPASGNRIFTAAPNNYDDTQNLVRLDHQITSNNRISGRYWNSFAETPGFLNPANYLETTVVRRGSIGAPPSPMCTSSMRISRISCSSALTAPTDPPCQHSWDTLRGRN